MRDLADVLIWLVLAYGAAVVVMATADAIWDNLAGPTHRIPGHRHPFRAIMEHRKEAGRFGRVAFWLLLVAAAVTSALVLLIGAWK